MSKYKLTNFAALMMLTKWLVKKLYFTVQSLPVLKTVFVIKDPKNSTPKLLDTINSYRKVAGYKINFQKSIVFLYTINEQTEKEYMETIPFSIASKKSNT
jgi:hypothetical protein